MLDTGTPPTGSAHQTAHTATFATEFEDLYAPAWVRMLLEQQANANRLMLEQQANINRLLEGLLVGQGPRSQHSRSMPDRNTPNSPHLPDDARDERNNARDKGNVVRDKHTPPAPQLFVRSLRPEEIATFNPSSGDDVEVFCRRIQDMAAVKSQAAICETLLQCLRSTATDWYTNLSEIEHAQLRASTSAWTRLLRDRFGMSVTEAHSALSNLRYDIASDYHAYHERKIRLARIAGINTEQVVHYIFAGMPFEMRNALASSLEGKEAGDLNVFRLRCLAQRATLLTRRSEQRQTPAPAFNQTVQAPRPHQNVSSPPDLQRRALADRVVQRPPRRPRRHCGGSHWDVDCTKTEKPSVETHQNRTTTTPLFRLPTEVWLHIFIHLPPSNLSSLSLTSRHALRLVDEHAFKHVFTSQYPLLSPDRIECYYQNWLQESKGGRRRSKWWFACLYAHALRRCWDKLMLRRRSIRIPVAEKNNNAGRGGGRERSTFWMNFAIPTLTLGTEYAVVGVRSELMVYSARDMKMLGRLRLNSKPPDTVAEGEKGVDDPWLDITALQKLDEPGRRLGVGFANGAVQLITFSSKKDRLKSEVEHHLLNSRRQEIAGLSIQPSILLTGSEIIASLSKRGNLSLYHIKKSGSVETQSWGIDSEGVATPSSSSGQVSEEEMGPGSNTPSRTTYRGAASNNAPSQLQDIYRMNWAGGRGDTRAWSVLLGSSTDLRHDPDGKNWEDQRWVAVGIMADPAVYIYPIRQSQSGKGVELGEAWRIASTGERMSVYAMATPPPGSLLPAFLLFVGFYDGVVRVYDTRQLHPRSTAEGEGEIEALNGALTQLTLNGTPRRRRIRRELNPIAVFREEFDADAIYSLSFGGPQGTMVVVGGARHAKVRVFDAEMLSGYDLPLLSAPVGVEGERQGSRGGDWTAFALHSTDSPVYGVVGEAERVVGVTDRRIWWFDLAPPLCAAIEGKDGKGEGGRVAYFKHKDVILSYSTPHFVH
ncbi:uncharacterized protein UBRO_07145 [Ustilago bromivora]|uniref:F-box domain-containing protein n=1 Tax=Ustilago bromivora TaxID=307758 RepID=A0A1K0GCL6_9BASI|nr:uncharacterized protein UBRO_07145 [Ustilago bromivora]